MFGGLFSPELADGLRHLTLRLLYSTEYEHSSPGPGRAEADATTRFQWVHVLVHSVLLFLGGRVWISVTMCAHRAPRSSMQATLIAALRILHKLTHLHPVIGASVYVHKGASWPFAPREEYAHFFRASGFDVDGTAAALARVLPSLRHVFITTGESPANWTGQPEEDDGDPDEESKGRWELYERSYISHGLRVVTPGTDEVEDVEMELHDEVAERDEVSTIFRVFAG